ncbi:MAG TPA: Rieske (2Fe-2S) protein [Streptosporangiaceae bacterium]|nr:Rieske (2Fe-2S) protein [Streptosporangiaceae bacterium]
MSRSPAAKPAKGGEGDRGGSDCGAGPAPGSGRRPAGKPADAELAGEPGVTLVPLRRSRARRAPGVKRRLAWTIKHNGRRYAVFDVDGEFQVTDAGCPHNGGPLADGVVRDGAVTCPWHWYCFDLRTGDCRSPVGYQLRKYPVRSRDGRMFAELPGAPRPRAWSRLRRLPRLRRSARSGTA